jgi:hypothetical protein
VVPRSLIALSSQSCSGRFLMKGSEYGHTV